MKERYAFTPRSHEEGLIRRGGGGVSGALFRCTREMGALAIMEASRRDLADGLRDEIGVSDMSVFRSARVQVAVSGRRLIVARELVARARIGSLARLAHHRAV